MSFMSSRNAATALVARAVRCFSDTTRPAADHSVVSFPLANSRISSNVRSPMPLGGTFTTRSNATSSWQLSIKRKYARAFLISSRS